MFDCSNHPGDSKFFDPTNKKVIGKMKEVFEGKAISEFVGLKSKMHSIKNIDDKEYNTAKGAIIATAKNIRMEHTKSTKYHYRVLMIKDLF